jgi:hypothetical protein
MVVPATATTKMGGRQANRSLEGSFVGHRAIRLLSRLSIDFCTMPNLRQHAKQRRRHRYYRRIAIASWVQPRRPAAESWDCRRQGRRHNRWSLRHRVFNLLDREASSRQMTTIAVPCPPEGPRRQLWRGGGYDSKKVVRYEFLRPFLNVKNLKKFQGTPLGS